VAIMLERCKILNENPLKSERNYLKDLN